MADFTLIEVGIEEDDTRTVKIGPHRSPGWRKQETAAEVARIVRLAYAQGRADQQATTSSILRGLIGS